MSHVDPEPERESQFALLSVRVRPATLHHLSAAAAREGGNVEAIAALWLEEHAEEVARVQERMRAGGP